MFLRLLFLINRFLNAKDDKIDLYLTKNENYPLMGQSIIIPIDYFPSQSEEILQSNTFQQSIQSISQSLIELKQVYNIQENFQNFFQLVSADQQEVKICYTYSQNILCDQTFQNYLIDNSIIKLKRKNLNFYTNSSSCLSVFAVSFNTYLLECDDLQGKLLKLIDENSKIIHQILIPTQLNQSMHILQSNQTYIIYEIFKDLCYFTYVEINQNFQLEVVNQKFLDGNLMTQGIGGDIVEISLQKDNILNIFFNQCLAQLDVNNHILVQSFKIFDNSRRYFKYISKQNTLQFIIDKSSQQQIQQDYRKIIINPKNDKLRNAFIINQNYIIYFESKIFISNNKVINYTLSQEFQELLELGNLPIIIGITKAGQVQIYQIFDLPQHINLNSSKMVIVINFHFFHFQTQKIYILEEYSLEKPYLIAQTEENIKFILIDENILWNTDQQQAYLHDIKQIQISKYLYGQFWQIVGFKYYGKIIQTLDRYQKVQFKKRLQQPLLLVYLAKSSLLLEFYQNKTLIIQDNLQEKFQFQNYNFNIETSQVFTSTIHSNVIIIDKKNKKIILYQYLNEEIKARQFKLKQTIHSILQQDNLLSISLENCTQIHIEMESLEITSGMKILQQNCTLQYLIFQKSIFYSKNLLEIFWITKYVYFFQDIIEFQKLTSSYFILFQLIENKVQSHIYSLQENKLFYLKKLITHEYQIHYPIKYKIYLNQYLTILAYKQNQDHQDYVVLIYDFLEPQSFMLIKIISIDDPHSQFSLFGLHSFIAIYKNEVVIENLLGFYVSIQQISLGLDTYIKIFPIELEIEFSISDQKLNLPIKYVYVNNNQTLRKRLENSKNQFIYSDDRKTKIINISNIFGSIDQIFYHDSVKLIPLQSTEIMDMKECLQYIVDICLVNSQSFRINPFSDEDHVIIGNFSIFKLIQYQKFVNWSFIQYRDQNNYIQELILNEQRIIISQQIINYNFSIEFYQKVQIIEQIFLTQYNNKQYSIFQYKNSNIEIFIINNESSFDLVKILFKNQKYYMMTFNYHLNKSTIILTIANENLITTFQHIFCFNDILDKEWRIFNMEWIKAIEIIDFIDEEKELKNDFLLCYESLQCYRILLTFNKEDQSYFTNIKNVIRYGNNKQLLYIQLLNNQYLILLLHNINQNYWNIFNLNQNTFIIDSYSSNYIDDSYSEFYGYNQTHFIESSLNTNLLNLRKFVDYQIKCKDICDTDEITITLQNDVSSINLTFILSESNSQFQIKFQIIIILINALLIILFNTKKHCIKQQQNIQRNNL